MSGKYLLDTSVIIALFADDAAVKDNLAKADEIFIPCITVGELYYGAWRSARIRENVARIDEFAAANVVLECNSGTARRYGEIKNALREKGRPIPENDTELLSACCCASTSGFGNPRGMVR
ncbi:MAG: ribonuclease VapC2 [Roseiflexus sp.]|nr:MAG: ribonuclease VapC2 [Anaerolineae bacterium]GIV98791.1 MAG: ribonuclease VapC2 [Roseiflexus sp.]